MNLDVERFLEDTSGRYAVRFAAAIQDLLAAEVAKDRTAARRAEAELEDILRTTMGMAEILGARLMLQQAAKVMAREQMAADRGRLVAFADQPLVPAITFEEALEDVLEQTGFRKPEPGEQIVPKAQPAAVPDLSGLGFSR